MTNRAYNIFCAIIGVVAAFVLYKLFVDLNIGSLFIQPPEPSSDGTVSTSAMQASEVVAGSLELILSILIAFGGTIVSITTGALKSLSRSVGIRSLWDNESGEHYEYEENERYNDKDEYEDYEYEYAEHGEEYDSDAEYEIEGHDDEDEAEDYEYEYEYVEQDEEHEYDSDGKQNDEQGLINEKRNKQGSVLKKDMDSGCLEESLYIAIKSKNKELTIALIQEMAGSNFLTGEDTDGQETPTPEEEEKDKEDSSSED